MISIDVVGIKYSNYNIKINFSTKFKNNLKQFCIIIQICSLVATYLSGYNL